LEILSSAILYFSRRAGISSGIDGLLIDSSSFFSSLSCSSSLLKSSLEAILSSPAEILLSFSLVFAISSEIFPPLKIKRRN
jgi:hypothetical protein